VSGVSDDLADLLAATVVGGQLPGSSHRRRRLSAEEAARAFFPVGQRLGLIGHPAADGLPQHAAGGASCPSRRPATSCSGPVVPGGCSGALGREPPPDAPAAPRHLERDKAGPRRDAGRGHRRGRGADRRRCGRTLVPVGPGLRLGHHRPHRGVTGHRAGHLGPGVTRSGDLDRSEGDGHRHDQPAEPTTRPLADGATTAAGPAGTAAAPERWRSSLGGHCSWRASTTVSSTSRRPRSTAATFLTTTSWPTSRQSEVRQRRQAHLRQRHGASAHPSAGLVDDQLPYD
jgi:hypothetical protein